MGSRGTATLHRVQAQFGSHQTQGYGENIVNVFRSSGSEASPLPVDIKERNTDKVGITIPPYNHLERLVQREFNLDTIES